MLLTIATTHRPATDLGYLLHKHPERVQSFSLPVGRAHVFYPEASPQRCTAALLLDVDPVGLVRRDRGGGFALSQYVNDRAYAASSLLSVAMLSVFRSAMAGTCAGHEPLAASPIPLTASLPVVPSIGGPTLVRELFAPLDYDVETAPVALDDAHPEWGASRYVSLTVSAEVRLADLLTHLYVLLPVLDDEKHYWVDDAEIDKLMRRGDGWLPDHPQRELIVRRYLKRQPSLVFPAIAQLDEAAPALNEPEPEPEPEPGPGGAPVPHAPLREQRIDAVARAIADSGARRVLDLGCGPGALIERLLAGSVELVVGADVSARALEQAARRLRLDDLHEAQRRRVQLIQSPLTYRDRRLGGFDAAALVEVIEHLDPPRLPALERNVFGSACPGTVVVTTPNVEYNARWETLPAGAPRHPDHRFEWTRAQFAEWARRTAERYGYVARVEPVGAPDGEVGAPTQMAVFTR